MALETTGNTNRRLHTDYILTKSAVIAESSVSAVKLYPVEYSCNMYRKLRVYCAITCICVCIVVHALRPFAKLKSHVEKLLTNIIKL